MRPPPGLLGFKRAILVGEVSHGVEVFDMAVGDGLTEPFYDSGDNGSSTSIPFHRTRVKHIFSSWTPT